MRKWEHGQQAGARQLLATTWQDVRLLPVPRTPIRSREHGTELECEPPGYQDLVLFMVTNPESRRGTSYGLAALPLNEMERVRLLNP